MVNRLLLCSSHIPAVMQNLNIISESKLSKAVKRFVFVEEDQV